MDAHNLLKARIAVVGAGLAALVAGLLVGTIGCCEDIEPIVDGTYEIVASPERPELIGAAVEIREFDIEITFTDIDGNAWIVSYMATSEP